MARKSTGNSTLENVRRLLTKKFLKSEGLDLEEWSNALVLGRGGLKTILFDASRVKPTTVKRLAKKAGESGMAFLALADDPEAAASKLEGSDRFIEIQSPPSGPKALKATLNNIFHTLDLERSKITTEKILKESLEELKELHHVGIALSAERNIDKLLDLIVERARYITQSDAGSLYIIEEGDDENQCMRFKIAQNDSLDLSFSEFTIPLNKKSIAGYVAVTGETLNIDDAYLIPKKKEYQINKSFDKRNKYRSKSMLTVPMKNKSGEIIGVLQIMNRKKDRNAKIVPVKSAEEKVIPYSPGLVELVESLASQAAVSLENALLYEEIQELFDSFVRASVTAIESRDPTTHGHSNRVADLTVAIAIAADRSGEALWRDVSFSRKDLKEIEYAGLLHDFGKIGVREEVLVKAKKLYPWDWQMLKARFDFIRRTIEKEHLERKLDTVLKYGVEKAREEFEALETIFNAEMERLDNDLTTIGASNLPKVLPEGGDERLTEIADRSYDYFGVERKPYLTDVEVFNLSLPKGSLNDKERTEIESHVTHTFEYLKKIHWGKTYKNVPNIAYAHHEKINGRGYPRRLPAIEIPLQSRMMTISDIYDALTASDRPYKKAVPTQRALDILEMEVNEGMLDGRVYKLFLGAKVYEKTMFK